MKVAFVTQPRDGIGENTSLGIINLALARSIAAKHEVFVYGKKNPSITEPVVKSERLKYKYISVKIDDYLLKPILKILRKLGLTRNIKLPNYASLLYYACYALLIALNIRKQHCSAVHIHNYSQFVPVIRMLNPDSRIILHMNCEWLTQMDKITIEKRIRKADIVLGCSDYVTNKIKMHFPDMHNKFFTLYNGVDIDKFTPMQLETTPHKVKKVLFIGRVSPEKGVHILIDAFNAVIERYPGTELHIIGPYGASSFIIELDDDEIVKKLDPFYREQDYLNYVKSRIIPKYEKQIIFHGAVEHDNLAIFYKESDIFVFPSVWNEPFGIPVVEAMSCSIPVISTKSGGISEILEHGKTGFLVERNNTNDLSEALINLLEDDELRKNIGKAGRERAKELFSWDKLAQKLVTFYQPAQPLKNFSSQALLSQEE